MITIKELLESVDLDFEPRWVTKDGAGGDEDVVFHKERPTVDIESESWDSGFKRKTIGSIKLAEFTNKHWTECIYEVPRKTTGKIEKFTYEDFESVSNVYGTTEKVMGASCLDKLNKLVDVVNKHADIIQQIGDWGTRKGECLWCEKITSINLGE